MGTSPEMFKPEVVFLGNQHVNLGLLKPFDTHKLFEYLNQLSATTRQYFASHPFGEVTITTICSTLDPTQLVRLVATDPDDEHIIGYGPLGERRGTV